MKILEKTQIAKNQINLHEVEIKHLSKLYVLNEIFYINCEENSAKINGLVIGKKQFESMVLFLSYSHFILLLMRSFWLTLRLKVVTCIPLHQHSVHVFNLYTK